MEEPKVNLSKLDRGDKTLEELTEELSPEANALVDQMAEKTIAEAKNNKLLQSSRNRSFYGKRNRTAWDRMNRQHRKDAVDRGSDAIHDLHARVLGTSDAQA